MCGEPGKTLDICTCTLYMEHGTRRTIARVLVHVYVDTAREHENSICGHIHV